MAADPNLTTSSAALHPEKEFSFPRTFARHWRESLRHYGLWRTIKEQARAFSGCVREFLPDRRRAMYGDMDYDWDHMVDTTRSNVPFLTQLGAALTGHQYFPTEPWLFEQIMGALPVDCEDFTFIDLGSGKGRALLMAARYGFKRIIGVEFMPEWHRVAQDNIARFVAANPSVPTMESVCMDARDLEFPAGPLVVYLFNPFQEPVFVAVMERLQRSAQTTSRPVFVAYRYTEFEPVLERCGWLKKIAGTEQWALYRASGDRRDPVITCDHPITP